jgi:hypothetical protein
MWQYGPDARIEDCHFACAGNIIAAASVRLLRIAQRQAGAAFSPWLRPDLNKDEFVWNFMRRNRTSQTPRRGNEPPKGPRQ